MEQGSSVSFITFFYAGHNRSHNISLREVEAAVSSHFSHADLDRSQSSQLQSPNWSCVAISQLRLLGDFFTFTRQFFNPFFYTKKKKRLFILNICTVFYSTFFFTFFSFHKDVEYLAWRFISYPYLIRGDDLFFSSESMWGNTKSLITRIDGDYIRIYRVLYLSCTFKLFCELATRFAITLRRLWKDSIFISFICGECFMYRWI